MARRPVGFWEEALCSILAHREWGQSFLAKRGIGGFYLYISSPGGMEVSGPFRYPDYSFSSDKEKSSLRRAEMVYHVMPISDEELAEMNYRKPEQCNTFKEMLLTERQYRALGDEGTKSLWDYWYGKVLGIILFGFIALMGAIGLVAIMHIN